MLSVRELDQQRPFLFEKRVRQQIAVVGRRKCGMTRGAHRSLRFVEVLLMAGRAFVVARALQYDRVVLLGDVAAIAGELRLLVDGVHEK